MKRWMRNAATMSARLGGKAADISRQRQRHHPLRSSCGARKIGVDVVQGHHMARRRPLAELGS